MQLGTVHSCTGTAGQVQVTFPHWQRTARFFLPSNRRENAARYSTELFRHSRVQVTFTSVKILIDSTHLPAGGWEYTQVQDRVVQVCTAGFFSPSSGWLPWVYCKSKSLVNYCNSVQNQYQENIFLWHMHILQILFSYRALEEQKFILALAAEGENILHLGPLGEQLAEQVNIYLRKQLAEQMNILEKAASQAG